ncbi:MAG: PAS domain-containing protein [Alphaproteobacteria bacterium]
MSRDTNDEFASAACSMQEADPAYFGAPAPLTAEEIARLGDVVLREIPDAVVYSDRTGRIRYWNAGAQRIFGYSEAEALGQSLDIIIPERLRDRHWQGYRQMMATGRSRHAAEEVLSVPAMNKAGDPLSIQFVIAAVPDAHGRPAGIVATLRDATETFAEMKRLRAAARAQS